MTAAVQSIVAVTYVRDLDRSRAFYELLGFHQESSGKAAASAWSALRSDGQSVVLTATRPPLEIPRLDNDPRFPGNGRLKLDLRGGR